MTAARLAEEIVAWPATLVTAAAAVVLASGVMRAPLSKAPARALAAHAGLALELFLAAGVIRLAALDSMRALAMVAAIIAVRQVIIRGVREAKA